MKLSNTKEKQKEKPMVLFPTSERNLNKQTKKKIATSG